MIADDLSGLEIRRGEYVCPVCHLLHLEAAGPAACDLQ